PGLLTGDDIYSLESWGDSDYGGGDWEHSASRANNDPFTDWVYWSRPTDTSPGETGYFVAEEAMLAGTFPDYVDNLVAAEVLAKTVLVGWNGGVEPPFNQNCPEQGTIFRITTNKVNNEDDVFIFEGIPAIEDSLAFDKLHLFQNYPNPFNPLTVIRYSLPEKSDVELTIYNIAGQRIKTFAIESQTAGFQQITWDGKNEAGQVVSSGTYFYALKTAGQKVVRKMVLLK
ncbi:MAG: T9SS type A sorting domain-containing protein, partial [Planctomycetes bacterium]|nr:T9SS type A sorting domain-containing protein [Planctomycetota bacterium]